MALIKQKIGNLITPYNVSCNQKLSSDDISGVNREKEFFEPARQVGSDTTSYKIVPPGYFACNLMHVGRDVVLPIAYNSTTKDKIVSPAYTVFSLQNQNTINPYYLSMMMKSEEMDRYFWFFTDSSVRDGLSFSDFCAIELSLPPLDIQQKYVSIYKSMVANLKAYEHGLEDLKLACDGYIENLKKTAPIHKLGEYIELSDERNSDNQYGLNSVRGISIEKKFIPTKADMKDVNLSPYYVVKPGEYAYVSVTSRNGEKISLALNDSQDTYICSSSYIVFRCNKSLLDPRYLRIILGRAEFDRYARYNSWGSARETFDWPEMCEVQIPVPDISIQKSIVDIFSVYNKRKEIVEKLNEYIKTICPILIKGSIEEARKKESNEI